MEPLAEPRAAPESGEATRHAFIIGSPRSGTTWVHLLLAQHPDVTTTHETHLFSRYFDHILREWTTDAEKPDAEARPGLYTLLAREDVLDLLRAFQERVLSRMEGWRPDARLRVHKAPDAWGNVSGMLEVHPDATFVHVLRDPRAVVASLRSASRSWGSQWAPGSVYEAAERWKEAVGRIEALRPRMRRYVEVRYEELHADTLGRYRALLEALEVDASPERCRSAVETVSFRDLQQRESRAQIPWASNRHPDEFYRKGRPDSWREDLTAGEVRVVEHQLWDTMRRLGYEPVSPVRPRRTLRLWLYRQRRRWARKLRRVAGRLEGTPP